MGVEFTKQQQMAIDTLDKSVLVSAAAGSGKTAVLIERIIKIILDGKAEVDQMLVVTFTKAAAAEMRLKLAKAIKKKIKDDPSKAKDLKLQLSKLYRAYISTFDSFAVRVIKEFFYEIEIDPDFKACDDVESTLLQREAMDDLFDECFEKDDLVSGCSFREFLRLYSSDRSEEIIKSNLISSYNKLRTMPDYWNWSYRKAKNLQINKSNFADSDLAFAMGEDAMTCLDNSVRAANIIRDSFEGAGLVTVFEDKLQTEINAILDTRNNLIDNGFSLDIIEEIQALPDLFCTLSVRAKDVKEQYESIKANVKVLRDIYKGEIKGFISKYCIPDIDTRLREMNESYKYTVYYLNLLQEFEKRYEALKKDSNLMDFSDMEHVAVSILENEKAANILKNRFKYIFIDEYQDTNNIQEYLIGKIAREDNVFKVGDVKQSIYRFRQAEPRIFQENYQEYSQDGSSKTAIDLNQNFRTNDKTIRYINSVFESIMPGYDDKAKLYTGVTGYDDEYDFIPEVHLLLSNDSGLPVPEENEEDTASEDEIENLSKEEAEARYVAERIAKLVGTEFYDTKAKIIRTVQAKDIVILLRSVKLRGDVFARALRNVDLMAHVEEADNYFDTVEIGIALSLFTCIDNMKKDVPLIATLHSEIFSWTPEELAAVRIAYNETDNRYAPYWEALNWYAGNGADTNLRDKAKATIEQIESWRNVVNMMPLEDFIWKVLVESGYYLKAGAMYAGDRRQANLRTLVDRARRYSENGVASLSAFLNFIEVMKEKEISSGQVSMVSKDDDVVKITTIHKSKGLEYPFVIVAGLGHKFRQTNNEVDLSFDSALGIGLPYVSPDRKYWRSTMMQRAINTRTNNEGYQEDLRVLYVAMTRARNKLILVGTVDSREKLEAFTTRPNSYLKVMNDKLQTPYNEFYASALDIRDSRSGRKLIAEVLKTRPSSLSVEAAKIYDDVDSRLSYVYPHADDLTTQSKYSVTGLAKEKSAEEKIEDIKLMVDDIKSTESTTNFAELGTAYHRLMEFMDFTKITSDYIEEQARYLADSGSIDEEIYKQMDLSKVKAFFASEIGQRAIAAASRGELLKEKAFTLQTELDGKKVLVQGVIDCCFTEDDKYILVDYKLGKARPEYETQIKMYAQAIAEGTGKEVSEAYLYLIGDGSKRTVPVKEVKC